MLRTPASPVGIGWRQPHYRQLMQQRPALGFLEVHSENFFAEGGAGLALLSQAREHYEISLHGVGLSLGSACGLDAWHLDKLARLVERIQPCRVSDHASFARVPQPGGAGFQHASDLLPIAFSRASLDLMVTHVQQVQERLRRPLLVENLSAYLGWAESAGDEEMSEPEFFNALAQRSGCGLLLDVNNLFVNARNRGADKAEAQAQACRWMDGLRRDSVAEIHLAGHAELEGLVIDDHGSRVCAEVWQLYAHALTRFGPLPSLIEWDSHLPPLALLLDEARLAAQCMEEVCYEPA
ncbi:uncharacterized protein (UPF0276 family) [Paucibacter oligotrophus]|uniref:Uncharacterized protein (UPF0276 family) n=1 Tax=Roseateles oligotrophus TaxID=1769250 RepID=A0A840L130_9BURK|nr:DUF692 domain-containing protein [Roseateles oligotrophus]MBB4841541.1 uncharacterized protein (UPF0276 family) [Roseateles oligotrophus]